MKNKEIIFVEELLRSYRGMKAERINLNTQWSMLEREKKNAIEGQFIKAQSISDMPGTPICGYKEPRLMLIKGWDHQKICDKQSFIEIRIKDLEDIITIIDASLNSLSNEFKDIVFWFYCDVLQLSEIGYRVHSHPQKVWEKKQRALWYLYQSLCVLEGTVIFKAG